MRWKTHAGLWVLLTVVRWVSFMTRQGVLPCKREEHVQRLRESTPDIWIEVRGFSRLTDIHGGAMPLL